MLTSTFPRWPDDSTPRFVRDLAELARSEWHVTVLAPHHPGAALREASPTDAGRGELEVQRFRYWVPASAERLCYGGGILPNVRASRLALAQVPSLVAAELVATLFSLRREVALVHAHFLVPQGVVAALAARTPLVVSIHGSDLFALRGRAFDAMVLRVLERATLVTVNGSVAADEVKRRFPTIEPKLRVLPMGVDTELFRPAAPERRSQTPLIAFVGRLTEQKGVGVLLEAFERMVKQRLEARLVIAGEGPELERLRARDVRGVDFVGPLSPRAVADLLREASLLAVPSLDGSSGTEAQGLVAIEAMAAGCPVVVSRSGGLPELVDDAFDERAKRARSRAPESGERAFFVGQRGISVEPSDAVGLAHAIAHVLEDEAGSRARADAARTFATARYGWSSVARRLLDVYEEARRC